ncbi:Ff.00g078450.m01.CDS01 [Fusarium sp. VM40]|nr:Ff.00g078450.m01.CDS01 [Fusarium sp. VM40]
MDYYTATLILLFILLAFAAYRHYTHALSSLVLMSADEANRLDLMDDEIHDFNHETTAERYFNFRSKFLWTYGLAIAADWLQASYLYSGLKNSHRLSEPIIAALFATGLVCAGTSTLFIGSIVDKYGTKAMCRYYCVISSLSCLTMLSGGVPMLFISRALGGTSNTILYSAFESWMVAEYHKQGFADCVGALDVMHSSIAITNGFVAVGSGVVAQMFASIFGSQLAPFFVSLICLVMALMSITRSWAENHGTTGKNSGVTMKTAPVVDLLRDPPVIALTFALCFFECSMSVVIYSWPQTIMSARTQAWIWGNPPFGVIFSSLMGALALGSFLSAYVSREGNSAQMSSRTVQLALATSATALLLTLVSQSEIGRFWALCLFELCVGMYLPSIAYLKDRLVQDKRRNQLLTLIRAPLNILIILCLTTTSQGEQSREDIFMTCSGLLLVTVILVARYVPKSSRSD